MLQSGFTKQLVEADILLFIEAKRILAARNFRLLCSFLVGIHNLRLERCSTGENATASQSEHLCRTNRRLSDKNTARYPLMRVKNLPLKISITDFDKLLAEILKQGRFPLQYYNRSGAKKAASADWSGQRRTSVQNV